MLQCAICGKSFKTLGHHIVKSHKMEIKDYYDKYILKDDSNKCVVCGKETDFISLSLGYFKHCSCICTQLDNKVRDKQANTNLEKYGVKHPMQSPEIKKSMIATNQKKYGVDNVYQSEKIKAKIKTTNLSKYGVEYPMQNIEIQERLKNTIQQKYGVDYVSQSDIAKQHGRETDLLLYGNEYHIASEHCLKKTKTTKLKKHQIDFSTERLALCEKELSKASTVEKYFYDNLKSKYSILYNASSNKYPYLCDFYIKELDLYIELNITWTHQHHFYNESTDSEMLNDLLNKDKEFYRASIHTWTIGDIKKRDCAIKNNLNYVVLWDLNQIDQFLADIETKSFKGLIDYNDL